MFDVYEGKGIDDGKKSVAIAVTIQQPNKPPHEQEIERGGRPRGWQSRRSRKNTGGTLRA